MGRRADYEGRILRSALLYPEDVLSKIIYSLDENDFSNNIYKIAFKTIKDSQKIIKPDSTLIIDYLQENNVDIDTILNSWNSYYSLNNIDVPLDEVRNRSLLNKLKNIYQDSINIVSKTDTKARENIVDVVSRLTNIGVKGNEKSLAEFVDDVKISQEKLAGKRLFGLDTGFKSINFLTKGFQKKHLWLIGGYTSIGKSWVGIHIANEFLMNNKKVLYISLEMSGEELIWRFLVKQINNKEMPLNRVKSQKDFTQENKDEVNSYIESIRIQPLTIIDNLSLWDQIKLSIYHHIYSNKIDCVVIDYIQNIFVENKKTEYESLNIIVRELQRMAVENNIFIACLSQVNRESQKSESSVFGFKGSGNLENAADVALVIKKAELDNQRVLSVGKNRTGLTGNVLVNVDLACGSIIDCGFYDK